MDGGPGEPGKADENEVKGLEAPNLEDEDEQELDDIELAQALGVPADCIEKMTPRKGTPYRAPKNDEPKEPLDIPTNPEHQKRETLTKEQQRDLRIQELQFLGCASLCFVFKFG